MTFKKRFIFLPFLALLTGYLFYSVYEEVKHQAITEFNQQQMTIATQTAKGIETLFNEYKSDAEYLAQSMDIINFNEEGIEEIQKYFESHKGSIKALTRVDKDGKIIFTYPYNRNAIGADISQQKHMKQILSDQKAVVSEVFFAVQNYNTIAYHVPVKEKEKFKGTLAILIPFEKIANEYLNKIQLKENGYAWLISKEGIELYCKNLEHIGKSIFENVKSIKEINTIVDDMIAGKEGTTSYIPFQHDTSGFSDYKIHAVYCPIKLEKTHWSICVATPEDEVLSAMTGFRNKLIFLIILLSIIGMVFTYFFIRAWIVLIEEKKRKTAEDELKLSRKRLLESEERFRSSVENSHNGIIIVNEKSEFVYVNKEFCYILGYKEEELIGNTFPQFIEEKSKQLVIDNYKKRQSGEDVPQHYKFDVVHKSGEIRSLEISSSVIINSKGEKQTIAQLLDVTERNKAESALRESEKKFRELSNLLPQIVYESDAEGKLTFVNEKAFEYFSYTKEEFKNGLNAIDMLIEKDKKKAIKNIENLFKGSGTSPNEYIAQRKDGTTFPVLIYSSPIIKNNQPIGLRGIIVDITDIKKSEEDLKKSEEQFRSYIDNAPDGILVLDEFFKILEVNKALEIDTGYNETEVVGKNFTELLESSDNTAQKEFFDSLKSLHKSIGDLLYVTKKGRKRYWTIDAVKLSNTKYLCFVKDITVKKLLEDQLRQSQKMEAIGQLAGGIAHDFNNILTIINGYGEMLLNSIPENELLHDDVKQILKAGSRAEALTRQLLAFSRKQIMQPKILNLNHVLNDLEKMLRRLISENIELRINKDENLRNIKADPGQIEQVILNLSINARDAMPKGGKLLIETSNYIIDDMSEERFADFDVQNTVKLSISDTGVGMSKEMMTKIYEPFFTTKVEGKGTGLGLSTVYGIVKQSDAYIYVKSEPGKGSTFEVLFKAIEEAANPKVKHKSQQTHLLGKETILVVEDEKSVRDITVSALKKSGYNVLSAAGSSETYELIKKLENPPDLLLTDVVMPENSGHDIAKKLVKKYNKLKVVYMSGYTNDAIVEHGVLQEDINFIQKPFTPNMLLHKIRSVLDDN